MSRAETEALITRYYEAFNAGDIEAMLACVADDVVHDVNQGGERRLGRERFHAFCERMAHHYRETLSGIVVMANAEGTRAAAEFNVSGTYLKTDEGLPPANGQTYQLPAGITQTRSGIRGPGKLKGDTVGEDIGAAPGQAQGPQSGLIKNFEGI